MSGDKWCVLTFAHAPHLLTACETQQIEIQHTHRCCYVWQPMMRTSPLRLGGVTSSFVMEPLTQRPSTIVARGACNLNDTSQLSRAARSR